MEDNLGYEYTVEDDVVMGPVIGKDQIREALMTLRKYKAGKANFDRRVIENNEWWKLRHWEQMREQGTTGLKTKSAWLINVILSKHADAMDALPEPNVLPRAADDKAEALMLSKIVPVVLEQGDFVEAWSNNWWKKLKNGVAIYGVFWDASCHNGLGDVQIRAIDPLQLFWEPGITDIQQSKNIFYVYLEDNDTLKDTYPQLEGKSLGGKAFSAREYLYDDNIDTSDKSPVIDWYYKKRENGKTVLHYCKFVGDEVLYATENEAQNAMGEVVEDGMEPAEDSYAMRGLYDHGLYPYFTDVLFPEEGTPMGYGYIDISKDSQRQIDLMNNAIVANCVAAATPRWLKRGDDGINEAEYADWTKPFVHVQGQVDESAIRQIIVNPLSGNYLAILQNKVEEMKETTGNRDVSNGGTASGVTAASAIAAMQEQSGKLSRDQIRNSYNCFKAMCKCVIELIRQFYDVARQFRIVGPDGTEEYIRYINTGLQLKVTPNRQTKMKDIHLPEFDLEISAQKQTEYTQMARNELAIQFYQLGFFNPAACDAALAAIEMMDFKGKDDIRRRIEANGTLLQRLQMAEAENMMLREQLGMPVNPQALSAGAPPAAGKIEQKGGSVVDKARARAQESTQPK